MKTEADIEIRRLAGQENFSRIEQNLPGNRSNKNSPENDPNQNQIKRLFSMTFRVSPRKNAHGTGVAKGEPR